MEVKIGLELHIELDTKTKLFSNAPISFGEEANSCVDLLDIAFPGSMPVLNKEAVKHALRVAKALNMEIDDIIQFERKNYFYSDLPKGYQLTQQFRPLGRNGYLVIDNKKIEIERLHLEEDTCKQIHQETHSFLDYNRSGIPLIEIVTSPMISSGKEARKLVEEIRSIVTYLGASKGRLEQGNIRVDVNVSVNNGNKVEIKNLNSLSNIELALDYEINRQAELINKGQEVKKETRRFDEDKKITVSLREKTESMDYRYFTDPSIPPIKLDKSFIKEVLDGSNELASERKERYKSLGLNEYDSSILRSDKELSDYFEKGLSSGCSAKSLANFIITDVLSILNKENIKINEFKISPLELAELVKEMELLTINKSQGKQVFNEMLKSGKDSKTIIKQLNLTQVIDESIIVVAVREVIDNNPEAVKDYKLGKDKVVGFIVGQVVKNSGGKINPAIANRIVIEELKRR